MALWRGCTLNKSLRLNCCLQNVTVVRYYITVYQSRHYTVCMIVLSKAAGIHIAFICDPCSMAAHQLLFMDSTIQSTLIMLLVRCHNDDTWITIK